MPKERSLASALKAAPPGKTRVVCGSGSLARARKDIRTARRGYRVRPSQPKRRISAKQARTLLALNRRLATSCRYHQIQPAVTASHNNDRVVVMPGVYTEPTARKVASLPPQCEPYRTTSEKGKGAVSYEYQYRLPERPEPDRGDRPRARPGPGPAVEPD